MSKTLMCFWVSHSLCKASIFILKLDTHIYSKTESIFQMLVKLVPFYPLDSPQNVFFTWNLKTVFHCLDNAAKMLSIQEHMQYYLVQQSLLTLFNVSLVFLVQFLIALTRTVRFLFFSLIVVATMTWQWCFFTLN